MAAGTACMAIFWPAPGFKEITFDTYGFTAEETFNFCVGG